MPPFLDHRRSRRPGYVLVLVAGMLFVLLGLAALAIDMGLVRLAGRQMLSGTEAAALEGLRWRDAARWEAIPEAWWDDPEFDDLFLVADFDVPPSEQQRELLRRYAARRAARQVYEDRLPGSGGDPEFLLGAGGMLDFEGGIGPEELAAGQTLSIPDEGPIYRPLLEWNLENLPHGDLVAGRYTSANPDYDEDFAADEDSQYRRRDFLPGEPSEGSGQEAFLARMRRTNDRHGLDAEPDVSSHGPPMPLLFGRGAMIHAAGPTGRSLRQEGITVRATSIAAAGETLNGEVGRVKSAGPPFPRYDPLDFELGSTLPAGSVPGVTPFAFEAGTWNGSATEFEVRGTALFLVGGDTPVGRILVPRGLTLGDPIAAPFFEELPGDEPNGSEDPVLDLLDVPPTWRPLYAYVPLYAELGFGEAAVGFGAVADWSVHEGEGGLLLTISRTSSLVAQGNATAIVAPRPDWPPPAWEEILARHRQIDNPLFAPVLVNRHLGAER